MSVCRATQEILLRSENQNFWVEVEFGSLWVADRLIEKAVITG